MLLDTAVPDPVGRRSLVRSTMVGATAGDEVDWSWAGSGVLKEVLSTDGLDTERGTLVVKAIIMNVI